MFESDRGREEVERTDHLGPDADPTPEDPSEMTPESSAEPAAPKAAGDDLLGMLDQVESRVRALREAERERAAAAEQLDARAHTLAEREQTLDARERRLNQIRDELTAEVRRVAEERNALEEQQGEAEDRAARLGEELDAARGEVEAATAARDEAVRERDGATERVGELTARVEELVAQVEAVEGRAEELEARAQEAGEAQAAIASERAAREEAEREAEALRERLETVTTQQAELASAVERAEARASALEEQAEALERRAGDASADTDEALEALRCERDAARRECESLREQVDDARSEVVALGRRVETLEHEADQVASREESAGGELARARQRLTEAGEVIRSLETRLSEAEAAAASSTPACAPTPSEDDDFLATRRARLQAVRAAMKEREQQLWHARSVLERKAEQLKQADEVRREAERLRFEAHEKRAAAERVFVKASRAKAPASVGIFIVCVVAALAACVGGAWLGVTNVMPGRAEASLVVEIDRRDVDPGAEQVASWAGFVSGLGEDPQFLERAATRLNARSIEDMASPGALKSALADRALFESDAPGRVRITLTGEGAGPTERALETIGTALVAYANDTRQLRPDRSSTMVVEPASATTSAPAEDGRLAVFGIVAGALSAIVLFGAVIAYRGLRSTLAGAARDAFVELGDDGVSGAPMEASAAAPLTTEAPANEASPARSMRPMMQRSE
jgi:predicted  nucleic acid-binding Zn-ribbon protein